MSGSTQTQNYANAAYPTNTNCEWNIQFPDNSVIDISFASSFRLAGKMPECPRSQLTISGCNNNYGPYCHLTSPSPFTTTCSKVKVNFVAGSRMGNSRTGFQISYVCIAAGTYVVSDKKRKLSLSFYISSWLAPSYIISVTLIHGFYTYKMLL